jgi:hypothetical protein
MPGLVSYAHKGNLFVRIPLSELNVKATLRVNEKKGITFRVVTEDAQRVWEPS